MLQVIQLRNLVNVTADLVGTLGMECYSMGRVAATFDSGHRPFYDYNHYIQSTIEKFENYCKAVKTWAENF